MKKDTFNGILFILILLFLGFPVIQKYTLLISEPALKGYIPQMDTPAYSLKAWLDGDYQSEVEIFQKRRVGFYPTLIRVNNQFEYSLFKKLHAASIIEGKEGHKYARNYIISCLGNDNIGKQRVAEKVRKLAIISDSLAARGVCLITIIAPGKGLFHPEYIPESYLHSQLNTTNYQLYLEEMADTQIHYIDMVAWFLQMKDTSRYVLFPKSGIHWSVYGNIYVGDSMLNYIERIKQIDLPELLVTDIEVTSRPRGSDRDVEDALNLIFPFKEDNLAYPVLKIDSTNTHRQLNVLAIGDSFYWVHYGMGYSAPFRTHNFWYYYKDVHPRNSEGKVLKVSDLNLKKEIESRDVIILMVNDTNLKNFAWNFIEDVYQLYWN